MHEGRVEQVGSPTEIYDDPKTPFGAGFVGSANVLHGVVEDGQVHRSAGSHGSPSASTATGTTPWSLTCLRTSSPVRPRETS